MRSSCRCLRKTLIVAKVMARKLNMLSDWFLYKFMLMSVLLSVNWYFTLDGIDVFIEN